MARLPILGLFEDPNYAAEAGDALKRADISEDDYDFLTDAPYPEGAFGERHENHRLYVFPFLGALVGLTAGILLTSMTQLAYPLTQGGKPILSLPPMAVVTYETTMLGAIIFTVIDGMVPDDIDHRRVRALGIVDIGPAIEVAGAEVQQRHRRLALDPAIAVRRARRHALEKTEDGVYPRLPVERGNKVHLRGAGIGEAGRHAMIGQGGDQRIGAGQCLGFGIGHELCSLYGRY